jgi:hypothetical protein
VQYSPPPFDRLSAKDSIAFAREHKGGSRNRAEVLKNLEETGLEAENHRRDAIRLQLRPKETQKHSPVIIEVLTIAEDFLHR